MSPAARRFLHLLIPAMFVWLFALQAADFHSTISSTGDKQEQNKLILWLMHWMSFPAALALTKIADSGLIALMGYAWMRSKGALDREWATCLFLVCIFYSLIVASNYV
jgi:hypothetical protein